MIMNWDELNELILSKSSEANLSGEYLDRLKFELKEIIKQGAGQYWVRLYNDNYKYTTNKNGLVVPWLLGMTDVDPIGNNYELKIEDNSGIEEDAIVMTLEDGSSIAMSPYSMIKTSHGWIRADKITTDHVLL